MNEQERAALTDLIAGVIDQKLADNQVPRRFVPGDNPGSDAVSVGRPLGRASDDKPFKSFGEQLQAVARASSPDGYTDRRLLELTAKATGMSEGIPSDGGFLVQQDFVSGLLTRTYEIGNILNKCRRIPISANANGVKLNAVAETSRATGSRWGGVRGYWVAEASEKTASRPEFRQMELSLRKLAVLIYATDELLADAAALEAIVSQAASEEIMWLAENAVINGSGAGQPLGILNAPCLVTVAKEAGQAAATVVSENISKMWARLWARSRTNAVWLINQDTEPQLDQLSLQIGTGGVPTYLPAGGLADLPYGRLKGRPVIPVEYCATLGTVGDIVLADFSEYLLADKQDIQAAVSIHVKFVYDETAFRFVYRVDGQPAWVAALTPANGTNTLSPFIALATRA